MLNTRELFSKPIEQHYNGQIIKFIDIQDLMNTDKLAGTLVFDLMKKASESLIMENEEGYVQRVDRLSNHEQLETLLNVFKDKITFEFFKITEEETNHEPSATWLN